MGVQHRDGVILSPAVIAQLACLIGSGDDRAVRNIQRGQFRCDDGDWRSLKVACAGGAPITLSIAGVAVLEALA